MALYVRMALYAAFTTIANQGFAVFDHDAGTLTFHLDNLTVIAVGALGFISTFIVSRFSTKK
jgi:hypothetical protein